MLLNVSNKFTVLLVLLIFCGSWNGMSQSFVWKAGLDGFFDNREYYNPYTKSGTITGTNIFAQVGFEVDEHNMFQFGANLLYEHGSRINGDFVSPIAYYQHKKGPFKVLLGSFNRRDNVSLPLVLLNDTLRYFRPQVQGLYIGYERKTFSQDVWLDWTSKQSPIDKEGFLIGASTKFTHRIFLAEYHFLMHHNAGTSVHDPNDHIRDNVGMVATLGLNLTDVVALDSCVVKTGISYSADRLRTKYIGYYLGSYTEMYASYKWSAVRNTLYLGYGQMQTYGSPLFKAPFYNRLELIANLFNTGRITAKCNLGIHVLPETIDFSQQFTVYIDITGKRDVKRVKY